MRQILLALLILSPGPVMADAAFRDEILAAHNDARAAEKLSPLCWDPVLAAHAQSWADFIAVRGVMEHAIPTGEGENLWMGESRTNLGVTAMVSDWIGEKADFRDGAFPAVARRGSWHDVGHYTQIMWRQTTRIGCGFASRDGTDYLVCRYWLPGNVLGQRAFQPRPHPNFPYK